MGHGNGVNVAVLLGLKLFCCSLVEVQFIQLHNVSARSQQSCDATSNQAATSRKVVIPLPKDVTSIIRFFL